MFLLFCNFKEPSIHVKFFKQWNTYKLGIIQKVENYINYFFFRVFCKNKSDTLLLAMDERFQISC